MPLELDEKDVKSIASRRYWARLRPIKVMGFLLLLLALTSGLGFFLSKPWRYFSLLPMLVAFGWFIWWSWGEKKAKRELVKEWRIIPEEKD